MPNVSHATLTRQERSRAYRTVAFPYRRYDAVCRSLYPRLLLKLSLQTVPSPIGAVKTPVAVPYQGPQQYSGRSGRRNSTSPLMHNVSPVPYRFSTGNDADSTTDQPQKRHSLVDLSSQSTISRTPTCGKGWIECSPSRPSRLPTSSTPRPRAGLPIRFCLACWTCCVLLAPMHHDRHAPRLAFN